MSEAAAGTRRVQVSSILPAEALARMRTRIPFMGPLMILHAWAVIALAIAMVDWTPALHWSLLIVTLPLAIMVVGSRQLGLSILLHEGAHGCMARNPGVNMAISQWFCAYPVFADTKIYRDYHLSHHAHAQTMKDPDLILSAPFPVSPQSFRRKMLRDLTGQTGFKQRRAQVKAALGMPGSGFKARARVFFAKLGGPLAANAVILAAMIAAGVWWAYPLLWIFPLISWQQAVTRVRNIAEHALIPVNGDPLGVARTTRASWIARLFLAPYYVNYHAEHHFMMYVPCYNLPKLHAALMASEAKERFVVSPTYREILTRAASKGVMLAA